MIPPINSRLKSEPLFKNAFVFFYSSSNEDVFSSFFNLKLSLSSLFTLDVRLTLGRCFKLHVNMVELKWNSFVEIDYSTRSSCDLQLFSCEDLSSAQISIDVDLLFVAWARTMAREYEKREKKEQDE